MANRLPTYEGEHVMSAEIISLLALVVAIAVGLYSRINLGIVSVSFAFIVGFFFNGMKAADIYAKGFPLNLFFLLLGTMLFAVIAKQNGAYGVLAKYGSYVSSGNRKLACLLIFSLSLVLSAFGMGTIVTPAIILPLLLEYAKEEEVPEFLATVLCLSGCIAGGLSPLAPTGVIGSNLASAIGVTSYMPIFFAALFTFSLQGFLFFVFLGGLKLNSIPAKPVVPLSLNGSQFLTILVAFGIVTAILGFKQNLGLSSFAGATFLLLVKAADQDKTVAKVPWSTLLLLSGVSVLLYVVKESGGLLLLENHVMNAVTSGTAGFLTALLAGVMSVVSSSSMVVMPTLIPALPTMMSEIAQSPSHTFLSAAVIIGAHSVAYSPFSTMGAIGIASSSEDQHKLFTKLLALAAVMFLITSVSFLLGFYNFLQRV